MVVSNISFKYLTSQILMFDHCSSSNRMNAFLKYIFQSHLLWVWAQLISEVKFVLSSDLAYLTGNHDIFCWIDADHWQNHH